MKTALVVTTYNAPKFLSLCLESLCHQSFGNFSVWIADDGSREETRSLLESFKGRLSLTHVWQEDHGYQKSKINNEVFRRLRGGCDVVICVDHDVILHRDFVKDHVQVHQEHSGERVLFMGRRVDLGRELTESLKPDQIEAFNKGMSLPLLRSMRKGETENGMRAVRISSSWLRRFFKRDKVADLLGSNFSISYALLTEVNGYNEEYEAYWGEDGDLFIRVRNSKKRLILGSKSIAIQFHLDHPRLEPKHEYVERYEELLKDESYVRCRKGMIQE